VKCREKGKPKRKKENGSSRGFFQHQGRDLEEREILSRSSKTVSPV